MNTILYNVLVASKQAQQRKRVMQVRYKLTAIDSELLNIKQTIMTSNDIEVLESMREMLTHFDNYSDLKIEKNF